MSILTLFVIILGSSIIGGFTGYTLGVLHERQLVSKQRQLLKG